MGLGPIIVTVVIILVISAVVGAVAQFLNKVNDANAVNRRAVVPQPRPQAENPAAGAAKPVDMDRFLAEIDRLRRKNAQASGDPAKQAASPVKPPPVEKPRPRVVAEVAEPRGTAFPSAQPASFPSAPPPSFSLPPPVAPAGGQVTRLADLPHAKPATAASSAGGQPPRVTAPARRASAAPKTEFGKAFAALIGTGKGAAMAVVLTEVLGPPKSKKRS